MGYVLKMVDFVGFMFGDGDCDVEWQDFRSVYSKSDELCIENDELFIANDELCVENDEFLH